MFDLPVQGPWVPVAIFLITLALNAVSWLVTRNNLQRVAAQRARLLNEISSLRKQAAKLNTPSTYAKCAKCQRLAATKERELTGLEGGGQQGSDRSKQIKQLVSRFKVGGAIAALVIMWGKPLVALPPDLVWPMHRMLSAPHGSSKLGAAGMVAVLPWLALCDRATTMLVQAALPSKRGEVSEEEAGLGLSEDAGGDESKKDL
mmetsp:Transcript_39700/g.88210  ORF Transcript_39700/g.88210 Transcript_39700/m.88210 type:complete len:203 (+) Transcript_39700:100-708(+)|eukprot:CAMPEP_0202892434 /NCGR_PEP_ID=MMETSP1392-20130828/2156_1 /ASSEMBLY_ACC=CAM_ASM_000868 /TAXON_ID=225041 /ORGANISM="Chlamydomonas chlamydogama, Strain SAG 11-48b" /LENGTH=202 /DNA_ID=CAMNT_0049576377 /DNA_START=84 /DNA_END=692 /DNA_ORIENTATION=-